MTWRDWINRHGQIFGLVEEADLLMIREWAKLFEADGYTVEELLQATDWLAMRAPPRYRNEHLHALLERLHQQRTAQQRRPREQPASECGLCGGCGLVCGLPDVEAIEKTRRWYTCCVYCSCSLGAWKKNACKRGGITFRQYEDAYPDWRDRLARHETSLRQYFAVQRQATALDATLGAILHRARAALETDK